MSHARNSRVVLHCKEMNVALYLLLYTRVSRIWSMVLFRPGLATARAE
jgi:hypothetical protein